MYYNKMELKPFESRTEKRRSRIVGVRLNPKEYDNLKKEADGNLSDFIRYLIQQKIDGD